MKFFKTITMAAACTAAMGFVTTVNAANWLMLQGTEPAGAAPRAKLWGFIQPEYQSTGGETLQAGPWKGQDAVFNQIRPALKNNKNFNMLRARIGVRGTAMPLDSNVNYFILTEMGDNGVTHRDNAAVKLTDASITLNHIKGARVRIGKFKTPGAEEGLQAVHVFDYINFTNVTNGLLMERYFKYDGSGTRIILPPPAPPTVVDSGQVNAPVSGVGGFRDTGIQVFDTFKKDDWEHSYAIMYGNGNGSSLSDSDSEKDTYVYWSSEKVYGGKGPRRQGWKFFAWNQSGKRSLTLEKGDDDANNDTEEEFDRKRSGIGTTFRKGKYRAAFEYITADGMIFTGTDGGALPGATGQFRLPTGVINCNAASTYPNAVTPGSPGDCTTTASWNMSPEGEADGWYAHFGYQVTPKWELDIRYDVYNRMTDDSKQERKYETTTLGAQYFFNKKTRMILNYEMRDAEAPNLPGTDTANKVLDGMDDRISAQLLVIF